MYRPHQKKQRYSIPQEDAGGLINAYMVLSNKRSGTKKSIFIS